MYKAKVLGWTRYSNNPTRFTKSNCSTVALRMTRVYMTLTLILALPISRPSIAFSKIPFQQRFLRPRTSTMLIASSGTAVWSYGCLQPLSRNLRQRRHSSVRLVQMASTEAVDPAPSVEGMLMGEVQRGFSNTCRYTVDAVRLARGEQVFMIIWYMNRVLLGIHDIVVEWRALQDIYYWQPPARCTVPTAVAALCTVPSTVWALRNLNN